MYEEVRLTIPKRDAVNRHRVPVKQWRKWRLAARKVFNELYGTMVQNRELFLHPKQSRPKQDLWKTTCWNAAWTAADALKR